jgi:hypothetical protein
MMRLGLGAHKTSPKDNVAYRAGHNPEENLGIIDPKPAVLLERF